MLTWLIRLLPAARQLPTGSAFSVVYGLDDRIRIVYGDTVKGIAIVPFYDLMKIKAVFQAKLFHPLGWILLGLRFIKMFIFRC